MEDSRTITATTSRAKNSGKETKIIYSRKSFWPLVFYTLLVIVVCLTGFNFYLFCWIWSSLSADGEIGDESVSSGTGNQWARMDTLSSWDSIKIDGRLAILQDLEVDQMFARPGKEGKLLISSRNFIQMSQAKRPWLEMMAKERRIHLPQGLVVGETTNYKQQLGRKQQVIKEPRLVCDQSTAHCLLESPRIRLSSGRGVDFGRKSAQTAKISTGRLHSPTNWLNLFSTNSSLFESKVGQIQLMALDELSLFSHNSAVILDANTIDVSRIKGFNGANGIELNGASESRGPFDWSRRKSLDGKYKLCICLPVKQDNDDDDDTGTTFTGAHKYRNSTSAASASASATENGRFNYGSDHHGRTLGLVFAVKAQLNCSKFSATFCTTNKSLQ